MLKEIQKIRDKYQEPIFGMALCNLIENGKNHFDDTSVTEVKEADHERESDIRTEGAMPIMTSTYISSIIDCAAELSKFKTMDILRFVKHYVHLKGEERLTIHCKNCDKVLSHDEGVEVNEGYEDLFYECDICHEYSMEDGSVILCETCGNYYTPNHIVENGRCFDKETTCPYCSD